MFAPRIVYGSPAVTINLAHQMRLWTPDSIQVGSERELENGSIESWRTRDDEIVKLTLVVLEAEMPAVRTFVRWCWMNRSTPFTVRFAKDNAGTAFSALLVTPKVGERIGWTRASYVGAFELNLELRSPNATPFDVWITPP